MSYCGAGMNPELTTPVMCISYIDCYACGGRIREFDDDVVLTRRDGSERRFYHTSCAHEARRVLFLEGGAGTWGLTYRPAFDEGAEEAA